VVHLNSSKIGGLGGLAGRIAGVPKIIFTAHGWAFNEQRSSFSKLIIKGVYLVTILLAHNTILVSEKMREQISKFPFIKNRITVIRNGIEKPELLFKAEALATFRKNPGVEQFLSQHPTPILVGTLAELHPIKGHRDAISAITLLDNPNLAYLIIGGGELEESLKTFVEEKGIKNVFFLGHLDQGGNYLGGLDYFLLPSHSEGLGYVLLEAGYAALPVIATDVGGIPEIIEDGKTGLLVPPKNPEAIKSSLEKLLQDQNMAQNIGKNLKEKV
jgi:glycosyltransferase involved in cell wall biosynthesis